MHVPSRKKHRICGKGLDLWAVYLNNQFLVAVQNGMNFNCACAESETPRYQKKRYCRTVRITQQEHQWQNTQEKNQGRSGTWSAILHLRIYRVFASSTVHFATVGGPTSSVMVVHCDDLTWSFVDERAFDVKTWEAWTTLWIGAENGKELRLKCQELNGMLMYLAHSIWRLKTMSLADIMNHQESWGFTEWNSCAIQMILINLTCLYSRRYLLG